MKKKKGTPFKNGAPKYNRLNSNTVQPVKLTKNKINSIVECLPRRANQARRAVQHLGQNPKMWTGQLNPLSGVNLSDVALKYNHYLEPHGLKMACEKPAIPLINGFGEKSAQWLWSIYEIGGKNAK